MYLKQKLNELILNPDPVPATVRTRLAAHWLSLPFKVLYGLLHLKSSKKELLFSKCEEQALSAFNSSVLYPELKAGKINEILHQYIQGKYLCKALGNDGFDGSSANDSQLCALNLIMSESMSLDIYDQYEYFVDKLVKNDYSVLEAQKPTDFILGKIYDKRLKEVIDRDPAKVRMKSFSANWCPRLSISGEKALTLLASLSIYAEKLKSEEGKQIYSKFLYKYGYGILGFFAVPRNDNCIISLYVLHKMSKSELGQAFWRLAMKRCNILLPSELSNKLYKEVTSG